MRGISDLPTMREVIAKHGLTARKSLGQNYINDLNLTAKIACIAAPLENHEVLEIGPGPGGLTRSLISEGAKRVVAVERDSRFLPALREIAEAAPGKLEVLNADALTLDPERFLRSPVKVVSNPPYNIASEMLVRWMRPRTWPPYWSSLTLMLQREVGARVVARSGTKPYGRLAILVQWRARARIAMSVPASSFAPVPRVDSVVVSIFPLEKPIFPVDGATLEKIVASAFGQRRKMLRSSLRSLVPNVEQHLIAAGVDPTLRAEAVSIDGFCALARELAGKISLRQV